MKQTHTTYLIIGAGPAGLGAAWRLNELGITDFTVYDRNTYVGGLAASFTDPCGFTWDIGGHVLHSHFPYFDTMFADVMENEYFTRERESWVWIADRFVPFPFQNNIGRLPTDMRDECLDGLRHAVPVPNGRPGTFSDWLIGTYGSGIAKHFLLPYNRKVWAYPLEKMSTQWVGDRVAPVDLGRIEENIRTNRDDVSWGPNAVFHYPKTGGTGTIWRNVARRFPGHIRLGETVTGIDAANRIVTFADGAKVSYDVLFTSMPLDLLTGLTSGIELPQIYGRLVSNAVTIVGLGIRGSVPPELRTKCWMYFPEESVPFFRTTVLSNYSPYNAPEGTWSLMTEITSSAYRPLPADNLEARVVASAKSIGLIPKDSEIVDIWKTYGTHGYPVPTLDRDSIVDPILTALGNRGITSGGRFGMWKYEVSNQDHTFMQGVAWANSVRKTDAKNTHQDVSKP